MPPQALTSIATRISRRFIDKLRSPDGRDRRHPSTRPNIPIGPLPEQLPELRDTKDYPKGVWTLPPTYVLKDLDHAKYEEIGESDRFTLKFVKL